MVSQKIRFSQIFSDYLAVFKDMGHPMKVKIVGTFLDQPNTFCFVNFALKLLPELKSDQKKVTSYCKLSDKNGKNLIF